MQHKNKQGQTTTKQIRIKQQRKHHKEPNDKQKQTTTYNTT